MRRATKVTVFIKKIVKSTVLAVVIKNKCFYNKYIRALSVYSYKNYLCRGWPWQLFFSTNCTKNTGTKWKTACI